MVTKSKEQNQAASAAPQMNNTDNRSVRYVVVREGHRVSPDEYTSENDPTALAEQAYWNRIATNHSWGEPVQIVQYDNKLHRIW